MVKRIFKDSDKKYTSHWRKEKERLETKFDNLFKAYNGKCGIIEALEKRLKTKYKSDLILGMIMGVALTYTFILIFSVLTTK